MTEICESELKWRSLNPGATDVNLDGYPGVSRVRGSNRMQTAYRIDSTANLAMPTL